MKISIEQQRDILKFCSEQPDAGAMLQAMNRLQIFDDEIQIIFDCMQIAVTEFNISSAPTMHLVLDVLKVKYKENTQEYIHLSQKIKSIYNLPYNYNVEYIRKLIHSYYKYVKSNQLVNQFKKDHNPNNFSLTNINEYNQLHDNLIQELSKINLIGLDNFKESFEFGGYVRANFEIEPKNEQAYKTPFYGLNEVMQGGGLLPGSFGIIAGTTGGFKTGYLHNIAVGYAKQGLNVLIIDTENRIKNIKNRVLQTDFGLSYKELQLTKNRTKIAQAIQNETDYKDRINIFYCGSKSYSCNDIEQKIFEWDAKNNWLPHVILWDYLDHMLPNRLLPGETVWQSIGNIYMDAKNLGNKYNLISIAVTQLNRDAYDNPGANLNVSKYESGLGKGRNTEYAMSIYAQDEIEQLAGIVRVQGDKNRYGKANFELYFQIDHSKNIVINIPKELYKKLYQDAGGEYDTNSMPFDQWFMQGGEQILKEYELCRIGQ